MKWSIAPMLALFTLAACSEAPSCDGSDAQKAVINAAKKRNLKIQRLLEYARSGHASNASEGALVYELEQIVMDDKNEQTGAVTCRARISVTAPDDAKAKLNIRYSIEQTSDGKLLATVWGL